MIGITFEGTPESTGSGKALPEGEYLLAPVFFSLRESRSGNPYMQIDYVVMDGEHEGKGLFGQSVFFSEAAKGRTVSLIQTMHSTQFTPSGQTCFFQNRFGRPFIGKVKLKPHYNDPDRKVLELDGWNVATSARIDEMREAWNADRSIVAKIQDYIKERFETHNGFALQDGREQEKFSKQTFKSGLEGWPKYIQILVPDEPVIVSQRSSSDIDFVDEFAGVNDDEIPF